MEFFVFIIIIGFIVYVVAKLADWKGRADLYENTRRTLADCEAQLLQWKAVAAKIQAREKALDEAEQNIKDIRADLEILDAQKRQAFPWLAQAYADYFALLALNDAEYLEKKQRPAYQTAREIRDKLAAKYGKNQKRPVIIGISSNIMNLYFLR